MTREELTTLIHTYASDYADFKLSTADAPKPPVNPVNVVLSELQKLEQQVAYWKLSFQKQCELTRRPNGNV